MSATRGDAGEGNANDGPLSHIRIALSGYSEMDSIPSAASSGVGRPQTGHLNHEGGVMPPLTHVRQLAEAHGARVEPLSRRTDVLVTWRGLTAKRFAADRRDIPVVSPEWFVKAMEDLAAVDASSSSPSSPASAPPSPAERFREALLSASARSALVARRNATSTARSPQRASRLSSAGRLPWLYGYVFNTTRMPADEREALRMIVERHGGRLNAFLNGRCDALLISPEYAAEVKELNADFEKRQKRRREREEEAAEQQQQQQRLRRHTKQSRRPAEGGGARQDGSNHGGGEPQRRQELQQQVPEDQEEVRRLDEKLSWVLSEKIRAAWAWEVPVLNYKKLLTMAQLLADDVVSLSSSASSMASEKRRDFDTVCATSRIEPAAELMERIVCEGNSDNTRGGSPRPDEASGRWDDMAASASSASHSSRSSSSSSETTVSFASSLHDYEQLSPLHASEIDGAPDGFTQTIEGTISLVREPPLLPACDPAPPPHFWADTEALTSQHADALTLPEEAEEERVEEWRKGRRPADANGCVCDQQQDAHAHAPLSAKEIVRTYYVKWASEGNAAAGAGGGREGKAFVPGVSGGGMVAQTASSLSFAGISRPAGDVAEAKEPGAAWQHRRPPWASAPAAAFAVPFSLHAPPFLTLCFVGCAGREERDAARMAHACRFLVTPMPTSDTDVVVLGSLAVSKKVYMRPAPRLPSLAGGTAEEGERVSMQPQRRQGHGTAVPPLRDAAAAAHQRRLQELKLRRRRRRHTNAGQQGAAGGADTLEAEGELIYFYEVSYELAESLKEQCAIPAHRLAPLSWLRACFRAAHAKQLLYKEAMERVAQRGDGSGSLGRVRSTGEEDEGQGSSRVSFGLGETFQETADVAASQRTRPAATGSGDTQATQRHPFPEDVADGLISTDGLVTANMLGDSVHRSSEKEDGDARPLEDPALSDFNPQPVLLESEVPNPHEVPYRVVIARAASSPFTTADALAAPNGTSTTAEKEKEKKALRAIKVDVAQGNKPRVEAEKDPQEAREKQRRLEEKRRDHRHQEDGADSGAVGVSTAAEANAATHAAETMTKATVTTTPSAQGSDEDTRRVEMEQSRAILQAFLQLLAPDRGLFAPAPTVSAEGQIPHSGHRREPCDVFQSLVLCFTDGEFARPFLGAVRALIKLGRGENVKLSEEGWRAGVLATHPKRHVAAPVDGEKGTAGDGSHERLLEAVRRGLLFGKRRRDTVGSASSRVQRGTCAQAALPALQDSGDGIPLTSRQEGNEEESMASPLGQEDIRGAAPGNAALRGCDSAFQKLRADEAAVRRCGWVALRVLAHAHEMEETRLTHTRSRGGVERAGSTYGSNAHAHSGGGKSPLRHLPAVTTDYLLCCLAAGRLLDPAACFLFHTGVPHRETAAAALLLRRRHQNSTAADRAVAPPPAVSAWQSRRRYEKKHVGVSVSFLWLLPADVEWESSDKHVDTPGRERAAGGQTTDAAARSPVGQVMSLLQVLCAAFCRVVQGCLGGTVCPRYASDEVTHVVLVDAAALAASRLGDSFLSLEEGSDAAGPASAPSAVLWPWADAQAAAADAKRSHTCIVSDKWLEDCLFWRSFIDEGGKAEYQRAEAVNALLLAAAEAAEPSSSRRQLTELRSCHGALATPTRGSMHAGEEAILTPPQRAATGTGDPAPQQTPRGAALNHFHFNTPGSTPVVARMRPADATPTTKTAAVGVTDTGETAERARAGAAVASPNPSLPHGFSPSSQQRTVRTLRHVSASPRRQVADVLADAAARPLQQLAGAMEMKRTIAHDALSQPRHSASRSHQSTSQPRHSARYTERALPSFASQPGSHAAGHHPLPCDREATSQRDCGLPQVVLSSAEHSLSQVPCSQTSQPRDGFKRVREEAGRGTHGVVGDQSPHSLRREDDMPAASASHRRVLARCSILDDGDDEEGGQRKSCPRACDSAETRDYAEGVTSVTRSEVSPPPLGCDVVSHEDGGRVTLDASLRAAATAEAVEEEKENEGHPPHKRPRLAFVHVSPPPRREDAFEVADDSGEEGTQVKEPNTKQTAAPLSTAVARVQSPQRRNLQQLAVYLLSDLPGREDYRAQYQSAVGRLLPTLPAAGQHLTEKPPVAASRGGTQPVSGTNGAASNSGGGGEDDAGQDGPFTFARSVAEADCLVSHELSQRESVLAAVAAGLWVVRPSFLSAVTDRMRKDRRCDGFRGRDAPALLRLLELHEWSPQALPARSPTPPPPPSSHSRGERRRGQSSLAAAGDFQRALATQGVRRRRARQDAHRQHADGRAEAEVGAFAGQSFVLLFPPNSDDDGATAGSLGSTRRNAEETHAHTMAAPAAPDGVSGSDEGSTAVAQLGDRHDARGDREDAQGPGAASDTARHRQHLQQKKAESIGVILHAGGARVTFAEVLRLSTPHAAKDARPGVPSPALVVDAGSILAQVAQAILTTMLSPAGGTHGTHAVSSGGHAGEANISKRLPVLLTEPLSVLVDSRLLATVRVRSRDERDAGATLGTWLRRFLLDEECADDADDAAHLVTAHSRVGGARDSPSLHDVRRCLQLAREHVMAAYETHRAAYSAAQTPSSRSHDRGGDGSEPWRNQKASAFTAAPPDDRPQGRGLWPPPRGLALMEQPQKPHVPPTHRLGSSTSTATAPSPLSRLSKPSAWASDMFRKALELTKPAPLAVPMDRLPQLYVAPREIVVCDMACVALVIAGMQPAATADGPYRFLGSLRLA